MKKAKILTVFLLFIGLTAFAQTKDSIIKLDNGIGLSSSAIQQYGIQKAIRNGNPVSEEYTLEKPLANFTSQSKTKSGADSIYVRSYLAGKFVNGLPVGKIIEKNSNGDEWDYYFNEKNELVKSVKLSNKNVLLETIEFASKCPVNYDSPKIKRTYKSGQVIKYVEFNSSGGLLKEINYVFDPTKKMECNYEYSSANINGLQNGVSKIFSSSGKPKSEFNYLNGKENGKCTDYTQDGLVKQYHNYTNGVKNGKYVIYIFSDGYGAINNEGGHIIQEGIYENGKRSSYKLYSQDGTFKTLKD